VFKNSSLYSCVFFSASTFTQFTQKTQSHAPQNSSKNDAAALQQQQQG
tara:strand:- start:160 stop:303 length:144 start_codon:yes stop_codon:yes gene_type:complete